MKVFTCGCRQGEEGIFIEFCRDHGPGSTSQEGAADLIVRLTAERDEWKRRAERTEAQLQEKSGTLRLTYDQWEADRLRWQQIADQRCEFGEKLLVCERKSDALAVQYETLREAFQYARDHALSEIGGESGRRMNAALALDLPQAAKEVMPEVCEEKCCRVVRLESKPFKVVKD